MDTQEKSSVSARLFGYAGLRGAFFELTVAGFLINILALALPLALLQMYNRIIPNKAFSTMELLIFGVIMAIMLESLLRIVRSHITEWLGARFEHIVSVEGLVHLMRVPVRVFMSQEPGYFAEQLRAVNQVRDYYSGQVLMVLLDLPFVIIYVVVIGLIGGWLAAVALILILIFLTIAFQQGKGIQDKIRTRTFQDDRRYNFLAETFRGIHTVKTMAMEPLMHRRYEKLQETNVEQTAEVSDASSRAAGLGTLFTQMMTVSIVTGGAILVIQTEISPGALAACVMLSVRALQPLRRSLLMWIRYQSYTVAKERLDKLFTLPVSKLEEGTQNLGEVKGGLELRDVTVQFDKEADPLFDNLNLSIEPGECIAILGNSGSGKTSLMSLLNGSLNVDGGQVLIDGVPMNDVRSTDLQNAIAFLPQQGTLVTGSILENITMFDDSQIDGAIRACEAIGLDKVVSGLRLGYDTPVGDGASDMMPAGVLQRIAIAREIIGQPKVILFDEANIAMDGEGDAALKGYLDTMKRKSTIVLVAHRPSLIRMADRVFALEDGKLRETSVDEHIAKEMADDKKVVEARDRPATRDWLLSDAIRHFPVTSDISLCLPALLASIKWRGSPRQVAEALPHLVEALDLSGLRAIMATMGFNSRSYLTQFKNIDTRLLPCLFVPENGGAKVILDWSVERGFRVFNSDSVTVETGQNYNEKGEAYLFEPIGEDADPVSLANKGSWLVSVLGRMKMFAFLMFAITFVSSVLSLATPLFVMSTFDFVIPTRDLKIAALLLAGVSIAFTIDWMLKRLKARVTAFMAGRTEYIVGNSIFQKVLSLPALAIERVSVSEQVSRVKDLEALREFFVGPLAILAYELPSTIVFVVVLMIINPYMLIVVIALGTAYALLGVLTYGPSAKRASRAANLAAKRDAFLEESLVNMGTIKAAGAKELWVERFRKLSGTAAMAQFQANQFSERVATIAQFISVSSAVAAMTVAGLTVMAGEVSAGSVIGAMIVMFRLTVPVQNAFTAASTLVRVLSSVRQINNLMNLQVEQEADSHQSVRSHVRGEVKLSRVSFRYSMNADPALLGISFDAEPGELVAIAGGNGSGKSTLLKLMVRAFHPQAGSIRLDGTDVRQLSQSNLREEVSYMPQHCDIFYGTIGQNLRLVNPTATDEEMYWAAERADVLDDILAIEQGSGSWKRSGFGARISDAQADQMPNGFRQRLGLARAFLKPAPLILLDEPGNGLDPDGDRAFVNALRHLRGKSTIFLVSHRPSHLKLADKIIYLENGSIKVMGPFSNETVRNVVMAGLG
jgi:ATP-binding cassette, subfamily C, bacterial LapB